MHWIICFGTLCLVLLLLYAPPQHDFGSSLYTLPRPCPFDTLRRAPIKILLDKPCDPDMFCSLRCLWACHNALAHSGHKPQTHLPLTIANAPRSAFNCQHGTVLAANAARFSSLCPYESRPWQALSHGPAGDAAVGGVTLSPSIMAVAQGPSLAAASGTTVPGRSQPHILLAFIALL